MSLNKLNEAQARSLVELTRRRSMALRLFKSQPQQDHFFKTKARQYLVRGGNRCILSSDCVVSYGRAIKARDLKLHDEILSVDQNTLQEESARVTHLSSFRDRAIRVNFEKGGYCHGTLDHPFWIRRGDKAFWCEASLVRSGDECLRIYNTGERTWDRVSSTEEIGEQEITGIRTTTGTYISDGIVSQNSGKSTAAAVMFAAIATDSQITLSDGTRVSARRPHQKGRPLVMWCIGYDQKHIGQTLYRLLFRAGLFQIIRDEEDSNWRAYREWDPSDKKRAEEKKPSPPLIPPSYVDPKSWSWENKSNRVFERVTVVHPQTKEVLAEIFAYGSKGDVKAGDPVDVIWIDEKIEHPGHYPEWLMRLVDKNGWLFWSSWPATDNDALQRIHQDAQACIENGTELVQESVLRSSENKQLNQESLQEILSGLSPEERAARDSGEFVTEQLKMYPLFDKSIHCAIIDDRREDELSLALRANNNHPPKDWTREIILDPGTRNPAVLFVAIPPPRFGDYLVPYDEIAIGRLDAAQLAQKIKEKIKPGEVFNRFLIDPNAARITPMGFSISVMENYSREFQKRGIFSNQTGHSFMPASNNVSARIGMLRSMMHIGPQGFPKLRIITQNCPVLVKQLFDYRKSQTNALDNEDKPAKNQTIDVAVCLEYEAASFPTYILPVANNQIEVSPAMMLYQKLSAGKPKPEPDSAQLGALYTPIHVGF